MAGEAAEPNRRRSARWGAEDAPRVFSDIRLQETVIEEGNRAATWSYFD